MKKLVVELSNERLVTPSGLSLVGAMLGKSDFVKRCNDGTVTDKRSQPQIKNGDILLTYIGLLCQGKTAFESVREMEDDPEFYKLALGITRSIPSAESLRLRMDGIGDSLRGEILKANVELLRSHGVKPTPLPNGYVPVDIDVTPFDNARTHKEGVSRTYKGFDGYAPIMAYVGTEGFLVNCELRDGKQHCQKHTPEFLRETLELCHQLTDAPLLIRMDSGNDASENIGILVEDGSQFVIKRNPRGESFDDWLEKAKSEHVGFEQPRVGKDVYIGSTHRDVRYVDTNGQKRTVNTRICYEVIEREIDAKGQFLFPNYIELNTWWTDLDLPEDDIIGLYHAHGESEQYHSEIKTDMDVERLPSGKFATNELVLELTILAYNMLRMAGQESLKVDDGGRKKKTVKRRRLRTVINNLILIAGHVTNHGRRAVLALGKSNVWRHTFLRLYQHFSCA